MSANDGEPTRVHCYGKSGSSVCSGPTYCTCGYAALVSKLGPIPVTG